MASLTLAISTLLLTRQTSAAPIAQSATTTIDICSLDQHDPSSWAPSGASAFMDAWFSTNGTSDWLRAMDQSTTTTSGFDSVLDCKPLGGNTCPAPVTPCVQFTPPELRLIRIAATNAHDFFTQAHEKLQSNTIENILNIDQIIADFAPDPDAAGFNGFAAAGAAIGFAAGVAGFA